MGSGRHGLLCTSRYGKSARNKPRKLFELNSLRRRLLWNCRGRKRTAPLDRLRKATFKRHHRRVAEQPPRFGNVRLRIAHIARARLAKDGREKIGKSTRLNSSHVSESRMP